MRENADENNSEYGNFLRSDEIPSYAESNIIYFLLLKTLSAVVGILLKGNGY